VNQKIAANEKFFSFEFFPPRTEEVTSNLIVTCGLDY
jgi:5,10-methylenetetrahydrofolate reductase